MIPDADRHARLTAAAPASLADKLRLAPVSGERRPVTALFADVVGSTTLAESMDPEDWTGIMNRAFDLMSQAVFRYEGTIAQLQGDALIAFFGAPLAHEDDPERAVRAGLDMLASIDGYAAELKAQLGIDFGLRIGINSGRVVVGSVGSDLRYEYTAMGDAVNVAARMQTAARPGTALVTDATHRLVAATFETVDRGPIEVKGKAEPIRAFEVLGLRSVPGSGRGIPGLESPLVGRDGELDTLVGLFGIVRAGRGRVACVVGEPGIGKSRLVAAFRSWLGQAGSARWVEARSPSFGVGIPYLLLREIVRALLELPTGAEPLAAREHVRQRIAELLGEGTADVVAYAVDLLALPVDPAGFDVSDREPDMVVERYVNSLYRMLRAVASPKPVIVLCEDLHWADPASVEALSRFMPLGVNLPLLLLVTTRPDRDAPGWQLITASRDLFGDALSEIRLNALPPERAAELVGNLLDVESLPAELRESVLARAGGNPFFLEEVIRTLIDRGAIERRDGRWIGVPDAPPVELPETLQGLLQARIDRLPAEGRQVMRLAAVLGRRFPAALLEEIARSAGAAVDVAAGLDVLEAAGVIGVAGVEPELEYAFRHVLIADAAYESLLRQERRTLHRAAGEALERMPGERPGILALHFEQAGDAERAVGYLLAAGRFALERFANHEARGFYERASALIPADSTDPDQVRRRVEATIGRVRAGWTFTPLAEEVEALEAVLPEAESLGDDRLIVDGNFWLAYLRRTRGETVDASPELRRALDRALEVGRRLDGFLRGMPLALLGEIHVYSGRFREGIELLLEALPLLEARNDDVGVAWASSALGLAYVRLGDYDKAREAVERARRSASEGDPVARLEAKIFGAAVEAEMGNLEQAMTLATECAEEAMELGSPLCAISSNLILGGGHLSMGELGLARSALRRGLDLATFSTVTGMRSYGEATLGIVDAREGDLEAARAAWDRSLALARAVGDSFAEASTRLERGIALHGRPGEDEAAALADLEAAAGAFEHSGARPYLARALQAWGEALRAAGREAEAIAKLDTAASLFLGIGLSGDRQPTAPGPVVAETGPAGPAR